MWRNYDKKNKIRQATVAIIMAVAMMMLSLQAMAQTFSYTHQGKTLYYYITSGSTIEVTYYDVLGSNNYVNGDVVIPSSVEYNGTTYSVTSIGDGAFYGCRGLTSVRCLAVMPPSIDNTSFYNVPSTCILTVPRGSLGAYAGSDWNKYFAERISEE